MDLFALSDQDKLTNTEMLSKYSKSKDSILLVELVDFYNTNPETLYWLVTILEGNTRISLRIVDWFVTNYARFYQDEIVMSNYNNIYRDYKNQLKIYNKRMFDPFSRITKKNTIHKFDFVYNNKSLTTTVGQMNLFKWACENKVFTYIQKNLDKIKMENRKYEKEKVKSTTESEQSLTSSYKKSYPATYQNNPCPPNSLMVSFF